MNKYAINRYAISIFQPLNEENESCTIRFECNDGEFLKELRKILERFYEEHDGKINFDQEYGDGEIIFDEV